RQTAQLLPNHGRHAAASASWCCSPSSTSWSCFPAWRWPSSATRRCWQSSWASAAPWRCSPLSPSFPDGSVERDAIATDRQGRRDQQDRQQRRELEGDAIFSSTLRRAVGPCRHLYGVPWPLVCHGPPYDGELG